MATATTLLGSIPRLLRLASLSATLLLALTLLGVPGLASLLLAHALLARLLRASIGRGGATLVAGTAATALGGGITLLGSILALRLLIARLLLGLAGSRSLTLGMVTTATRPAALARCALLGLVHVALARKLLGSISGKLDGLATTTLTRARLGRLLRRGGRLLRCTRAGSTLVATLVTAATAALLRHEEVILGEGLVRQ